ncbi:hypothetical protein [Gudongella sp. DL1XJH-153]|uniref:hypothetical protein n=1 Tax=Gudongella sp. DL1XJH-153 TaxID=3409804 RepID=UPI003BB6B78E
MMKKTIIILLVLAVAFTAGGIFMKYNAYAMGFGGYYNQDQNEEFYNQDQNEEFYNNRMPGRGGMDWNSERYDDSRVPDEREEDLNVWPNRGYQYPNHPMWGYDEFRNNPNFEGFEDNQEYFRGCRGNFYRDGIWE